MSFRLLFSCRLHRTGVDSPQMGYRQSYCPREWECKINSGMGQFKLSSTYIPILSDSKTADIPSTASQRQSDEACSKQQAKAQTQGKINFWLWIKWKSLLIEIYQSDEPLQGSSLLDYLFMYRKPGWLWTDFHYFHKYLHNDEFNSGFHMGISLSTM